jgi:hypothetical protein
MCYAMMTQGLLKMAWPDDVCKYGAEEDIWSRQISKGRREQHHEELNNFYSLPNTVRMIKSKRVRWMGPAACMRKRQMHTKLNRTEKKVVMDT